jgi:hypothetical protein
MNLLRLVKGIVEMMRIPDATAEGIATRAAANLANIPIMRSQKQAA